MDGRQRLLEMASGLDPVETGRISASGQRSQWREQHTQRRGSGKPQCLTGVSPASLDCGMMEWRGWRETFLEGNLGSCCGKVLNSG